MNEPSSSDSTIPSSSDSDAVSRRAYEIWESEGRPEGGDMRHWLQAEQELKGNTAPAAERAPAPTEAVEPATHEAVVTPTAEELGAPRAETRSRAPEAPMRGGKRGSNGPFNGGGGSSQATPGRRKPNAPTT